MDYDKQLATLPKQVKEHLTSSRVLDFIDELEQQFGVPIFDGLIKFASGSLPSEKELQTYFEFERGMEEQKAASLVAKIRASILKPIERFLSETPAMSSTPSYSPNQSGTREAQQPSPLTTRPIAPLSVGRPTRKEDDAATRFPKTGTKQERQSGFHPQNIYELTKQLIDSYALELSSDILRKRFAHLVESGVRGIRKPYELREIMARSIKIGGMGFDRVLADRVVNALEQHIGRFSASRSSQPPSQDKREKRKQTIWRLVKLPGSVKKPQPKIQKEEESKKPVERMEKPLPSKAEGGSLVQHVDAPKTPIQVVVQEPASVRVRRPRVYDTGRPQVQDIKHPAEVIGPIDELRRMSLSDFRSLGENTEERIQKVRHKVSILKEESLSQWLEGVEAWKESPLHRLYLDIGNESFETQASVYEVIGKRTAQGAVILTQEEFDAIADLNLSLRF